MDKWPMVRLGDVCEFSGSERGANYPSGKNFCDSGIPFINAENLVDGQVSYKGMKYITEQKYDELKSGNISNGDWLYSLRGQIGIQVIAEGFDKAAVASSVVIIRPKSVFKGYLWHCLNSRGICEQQMKADNGILLPNLSATNVRNFVIPLPPLPIQKEVTEVLDRVLAVIKKRKAQIEELDGHDNSEDGRTDCRTEDRTEDRTGGRTDGRTEDRTGDRTGDRTDDRTEDRTEDRTNCDLAGDSRKSRLQRSLRRLEALYQSRMSKCFEGEMLSPPAGYTSGDEI